MTENDVYVLAISLGFPVGSVWDRKTREVRWEGKSRKTYATIRRNADTSGWMPESTNSRALKLGPQTLLFTHDPSESKMYPYTVTLTVPEETIQA